MKLTYDLTELDITSMYSFFYIIFSSSDNHYEFVFNSQIIRILPEICMDKKMRFTIKMLIDEEFEIIGQCSRLDDIKIILTAQYIQNILDARNCIV